MSVRKFNLTWNPVTGSLRATSPSPRLKRQEPVTLVVLLDAEIPDAADLSLVLRQDDNYDGEPLLTVTEWTWDSQTLTWSVDVTIASEIVDALLCVNDTSADDVGEAPAMLDVRAFAANGTTELAASSTLKLTLENNPGRDTAEYIQSGGPT